jgi:hypothetical protein
MGKRGIGPLPPEVSDLERVVAAWRRTRQKGAATPSEFWEAAVPLAMQFGICKIGRAVGLDYTVLRKQVAITKERQRDATAIFAEVPAGLLLAASSAPKAEPGPTLDLPQGQTSGAVIELSTPDGARMRICLEPGKDAEAALCVSAFLRRGH